MEEGLGDEGKGWSRGKERDGEKGKEADEGKGWMEEKDAVL